MKRTTKGLLVVALGLVLATAAAAYTGSYSPGAGITGTVHDLGIPGANGMGYSANPADSLQRICIFCHAPHNTYKLSPANGGPGAGIGAGPQAGDDFTYLPLWNHSLQSNTVYTMYQNGPGAPQNPTSPNASQAIANGMTPGGTSLLCLSCHDGSVAVNSYGNSAQLARSQSLGGGATIGAQYVIGKDQYLGNHHPIGFNYDLVQSVDTAINSADTATFNGAADYVRNHLYGPGNQTMECGTCHSVHNRFNAGETLLWVSDTRSALCLTCHIK